MKCMEAWQHETISVDLKKELKKKKQNFFLSKNEKHAFCVAVLSRWKAHSALMDIMYLSVFSLIFSLSY